MSDKEEFIDDGIVAQSGCRSGERVKSYVERVFNPITLNQENVVQTRKSYHKHLLRYDAVTILATL